MTFAHLAAADIEQALAGRSRQYLVGKLKLPQALRHIEDGDVETGLSVYEKAGWEPAHRHSAAKEYQYVLEGMTEYMDVETREVFTFRKGDFYVIYPGTSYIQRIKRATRILFFKFPGGNDKQAVEPAPDIAAWAQTPLRVKRLDMKAGDAAPVPNSLKPAVAAAVFDEKGRLLLTKRRDNGFWTMPGGMMELDEDVAQCAVREVAEETGVAVRVERLIGTYTDPRTVIAYSDGEVRREFSVLLLATAQGGALRVDDESTEAVWAEVARLADYPMTEAQRRRVDDALASRATGATFVR